MCVVEICSILWQKEARHRLFGMLLRHSPTNVLLSLVKSYLSIYQRVSQSRWQDIREEPGELGPSRIFFFQFTSCRLLCRIPSIHDQCLPRHERGPLRAEPDDPCRNLLRFAKTLHRVKFGDLLVDL
jgi:hypothetical protein